MLVRTANGFPPESIAGLNRQPLTAATLASPAPLCGVPIMAICWTALCSVIVARRYTISTMPFAPAER